MLGVAYQTVERRGHNRNPISTKSKLKIIAFIGYDPETVTGDSNRRLNRILVLGICMALALERMTSGTRK
jgi:hypothetical protein